MLKHFFCFVSDPCQASAPLNYKQMCLRCEPFSTYPRTYDLLHSDHIFSHYQSHGDGCLLEDIMLEMDRIIRPQVRLHLLNNATTQLSLTL